MSRARRCAACQGVGFVKDAALCPDCEGSGHDVAYEGYSDALFDGPWDS